MKEIIYILSLIFFTNLQAYNMEDFEFYTKACERNQYVSCSHLAIIYEQDKLIKQDMKKAEKLYIKACGGNDAFACHNVAVIYSKSDKPTLKNISLKFYEKACIEGEYAKSCLYLGRLYRDSHTLERDYKKAKKMFAIACEANDYLGCKEERILKEAGY